VLAITANPTGNGDRGSCEEGFYFVDGDVLTMCDSTGHPLRDSNTGERVTHKLAPGENPVAVAKRITLRLWRAATARSDDLGDFNRPLHYPRKHGFV